MVALTIAVPSLTHVVVTVARRVGNGKAAGWLQDVLVGQASQLQPFDELDDEALRDAGLSYPAPRAARAVAVPNREPSSQARPRSVQACRYPYNSVTRQGRCDPGRAGSKRGDCEHE